MYNVEITRAAQDQLVDLPNTVFSRVTDAIQALGTKPRPHGGTKLSGLQLWKIRVGDYRIIYAIDDSSHTVTVVKVGHRRDVYR